MVPGRSADRAEEQDHAALGQPRGAALGIQRPADEIGLFLRRDLPGARQGRGAGAAFCNTKTMTLHVAEIALAIAPGAHAVVLMDQAGWHMTDKLDVPGNISIIVLPAKCPELNPVENIWQFMRDNWLSNRVYLPRQYRRTLLRGVEQARRATLAHYDHRAPQMGPWVMINAGWYKPF